MGLDSIPVDTIGGGGGGGGLGGGSGAAVDQSSTPNMLHFHQQSTLLNMHAGGHGGAGANTNVTTNTDNFFSDVSQLYGLPSQGGSSVQLDAAGEHHMGGGGSINSVNMLTGGSMGVMSMSSMGGALSMGTSGDVKGGSGSAAPSSSSASSSSSAAM